MSRFIGATFAANSSKTDLIFTNIKPPGPPYKSSDVTAFGVTKTVADRFIVFGALKPEQLSVASDLVNESTGFQYWHFRSLALPAEMQAELRDHGKLTKTVPITYPDRSATLADKLRSFYWYKVMKKGQQAANNEISSDVVDIYEIRGTTHEHVR